MVLGGGGRGPPSPLRVLLAGSTRTRRTPALERGSRSEDLSVSRPDTSPVQVRADGSFSPPPLPDTWPQRQPDLGQEGGSLSLLSRGPELDAGTPLPLHQAAPKGEGPGKGGQPG